jgi:hypothetical protein
VTGSHGATTCIEHQETSAASAAAGEEQLASRRREGVELVPLALAGEELGVRCPVNRNDGCGCSGLSSDQSQRLEKL